MLELSDDDYANQIGDFYTSLTTDKRFILLDSAEWDLKDKHKVDIVLDVDDEEDESDATDEEDESDADEEELMDEEIDSIDITDDEVDLDDSDDMEDLTIVDDIDEDNE